MPVISDFLLSQLSELAMHQRIVVAYSGGVDSHVLLHALAHLRNNTASQMLLEVLHIHHGVSKQADIWVTHCQWVCRQLQVPLTVKKISCDLKNPSLENQLRKARYQIFSDFISFDDLLVLAHHCDDQAETLLLRMLRGVGGQGLAGMPAKRSLGSGCLVRPLLGVTRADIEKYARHHKLSWIEDDSNADTVFDRNFLRHKVMPQLAQRWPQYQRNFERNAKVAKAAEYSLDYFLVRELQPQMERYKGGLSCKWLTKHEVSIQINLLRAWLKQCHLPPPNYQHIQQVLKNVVQARVDAQPLVKWQGVEVRRFSDIISASAPLPYHDTSTILDWNFSKELSLPGAGVLFAAPLLERGFIYRLMLKSILDFVKEVSVAKPLGKCIQNHLKSYYIL